MKEYIITIEGEIEDVPTIEYEDSPIGLIGTIMAKLSQLDDGECLTIECNED